MDQLLEVCADPEKNRDKIQALVEILFKKPSQEDIQRVLDDSSEMKIPPQMHPSAERYMESGSDHPVEGKSDNGSRNTGRQRISIQELTQPR